MKKNINVSVTCPKCATKLAIPIAESDVGTKKQCICNKCTKIFILPIPHTLASKFESDPTMGGNTSNEVSLILESISNANTACQTFELTSDYYTVGRKNSSGPEYRPDVEIVTTDKKISRKHAAIRKKGKGFTLKDLGSKNGISLNGAKLDPDEEIYLTDGDIMQIGDTQFHVRITEQTMDSNDLTI